LVATSTERRVQLNLTHQLKVVVLE
jgi:hypothetical protein